MFRHGFLLCFLEFFYAEDELVLCVFHAGLSHWERPQPLAAFLQQSVAAGV
jgi:hypothetical protein